MTHFIVISTSFPDEYFAAGEEAAGSFVHDFVVELANYVAVTAVVPSGQASINTVGNLTIHRFPVPSLPLSLLNPTNPLQWTGIIKTLKSGETAVYQAVQHKTVDHILALWVLPSGYWARKASQTFHIPYSIWALGSDIWGLGKIPLVRNVLRTVLQESENCFADGYQLTEDVAAISGRNCAFLPSSRKLPIATSKQLADSAPYKLAFLGRWHPNKGIDLLFESLQLLNDADWQKIEEVRIFGGGPLESMVKRECEILRTNGRSVTLGGFLNRKDAAALLFWADYLLLPSRKESIPVIFSDALQAQCPLVSTPTGDLPRLLESFQVGILADELTAVSFKSAIQKAIRTAPKTFQNDLQLAEKRFRVDQSVTQLREIIAKNSSK